MKWSHFKTIKNFKYQEVNDHIGGSPRVNLTSRKLDLTELHMDIIKFPYFWAKRWLLANKVALSATNYVSKYPALDMVVFLEIYYPMFSRALAFPNKKALE